MGAALARPISYRDRIIRDTPSRDGCGQLDQVRKIRNDVMHFDPAGIQATDLQSLRNFARFLRKL
jgi:DNA-directed RNA polymerase specialized sigma54-like protein